MQSYQSSSGYILWHRNERNEQSGLRIHSLFEIKKRKKKKENIIYNIEVS